MSKKFIFKAAFCLVFVAVAVVWLLSVIYPDQFKNFSTTLLLGIVLCIFGALFILKGLFEHNVGVAKKFNILFGVVLGVAAVFAFVGTIIKDALAFPIVAIIIT